jgi:hypothetical protein
MVLVLLNEGENGKIQSLGSKIGTQKSPKFARRWHACRSSNLQRETFPHRISLTSQLCGLSFGLRGFDVEAVVEFE